MADMPRKSRCPSMLVPDITVCATCMDPDPDFLDPDFLPIRIRTKENKYDPDPDKRTGIRNTDQRASFWCLQSSFMKGIRLQKFAPVSTVSGLAIASLYLDWE